jgi:hypothetical protein
MPDKDRAFRFQGSIDQLPLLIELFYGFAIANGLADGVKSVIEKERRFRFIFLILALFLALADWIGYYLHIAPFKYKGVIRFLMDLMFPVFIYCLLIAPGIASSDDYVIHITYVVFAYFSWAFIYTILLYRDVKYIDRHLFPVIILCFTVSAVAVGVGCYKSSDTGSRALIEVLTALGIVLWSGYNIRLLHLAIRERSAADSDNCL